MTIKYKEIHAKTLKVANEYRSKEIELIDRLIEVESTETFRYLGFTSLFQYCVKALSLSEHQAYNFIAVARKSKKFPKLKKAIETKKITVSKARKISSVLKEENQDAWLKLASLKSQRDVEREVAKVNPREKAPDSAKFISEKLLDVRMSLSKEVYEKLNRVKELEQNRAQKSVSFEDVLDAALSLYLDTKEPVKKAEKMLQKPSHQKKIKAFNSSQRQDAKRKGDRQYISSATRYHLYLRSHGHCEHTDSSGRRCTERKWLDIHHKIPVALGGTNHPDNLMLICKGHHRLLHFELDKQKNFKKSQPSHHRPNAQDGH